MRTLAWLCFAFVLLVLQTTGLGTFISGDYVDLPLLFVYNMALLKGAEAGGCWGLGLGLVQDLLSAGVFGFHALTRTLLGFWCGTKRNVVFQEVVIYHIGVIGVLSALVKALYLVPLYFLAGGFQGTGSIYLQNSLWYCLGNMLLVLPMGYAMRVFEAYLDRKDY